MKSKNRFPLAALAAAILAALSAGAAQAQTTPDPVSRDVRQEQRIEQGLQSGALTTREAAGLERQEAHVDHMEAKALKDGTVSADEAARIRAAQDRASASIAQQKHDAQRGDPASASSRRMQANVQRNVNQEARIDAGMKSGALNAQEAARLEAGQARTSRAEARAGRDGHVGVREQGRIQHRENVQSRHIRRQKHDDQTKP